MNKRGPLQKAADENSIDYWRGVVARQMDMLRSYKMRQDDVYRGLGQIQKLVKMGAGDAAVTLLEELPARELKFAKERVDNYSFAMDIAIKLLNDAAGYCEPMKNGSPFTDGLSQMEILVPEAFEKKPAPAGGS